MEETKKCRHCKSEIDKKAKICPNCSKNQTNPFIKVLLIFVGVIVLIGACSSLMDDVEKEQKERFTHEVTKEYNNSIGEHYIEGTVKNETDKEYSYVQIEFVCYDADGNNLGTAIDNTNNLLANETWKFKAMGLFTDKTTDHCDFKEITSW